MADEILEKIKSNNKEIKKIKVRMAINILKLQL